MRPRVRFLGDSLVQKIVEQARSLLCTLGVEVHNDAVLALLSDHGADVTLDTQRAILTDDILDRALGTVATEFRLYDVNGENASDLSGDRVHFTPGSAAINILDYGKDQARPPTSEDYATYAKLVEQLGHIAFQSTAIVPSDVPEHISDSYRLFLSLILGTKPVITGAFTIEAFDVMRDLQVAVRGSERALAEKPLTVFSCCPTAPLKWSDVTSQNVVDCARYGIPVEYISMPLTGFVAPVTLVGTLVQHTAETLSGIVISQLTNPGTPALYGGSPAVFDIRYETTPMGAVETMLLECGYSEIGKHLGLPTQAYMGLSDAKLLDAQSGLETSMGATLAALAGINSVSGPGMLDFESCFSLEKLVLDNEICAMALRLAAGIEPREDFPALPHFEELLKDKHLLISDHTRKFLRAEHYFPGAVIDRANRSRWRAEGSTTLGERANRDVRRLLNEYVPTSLPDSIKGDLIARMRAEAKHHDLDRLPTVDV
jgi:trimethylamine--corrinoid protein Co-methyltransferase